MSKDRSEVFTRDEIFEAPRLGASGKKRTVEEWAKEKGFLPEMLPVPQPAKGQIPEAPQQNAQFWRFAGARALMNAQRPLKWPEGAEVTEAEFDAAIEQATNGVLR